jgi:hypothetical protein
LRLIRQLLFESLTAASQVTRQRLIRRDRGKQLGFFLDHLGEPFFHQAVQHFINLLARDVRASGQFQCLESRMPHQHQVGSRFVGIQAHRLQPLPEAPEIDLGKFLRHVVGRG